MVASILACLTPPAFAQEWATRALCDVSDPVVDISAYSDIDFARAQAEAAAIPNAVGNFWKIESTDGAVSYLWGTNHANNPTVLDLPDAVKAEIEAARVVALEFDPVFRSRAEVTRFNTEEDPFLGPDIRGTYPTNQLDTILGPKLFNWIDARLAATGWGADTALYLKPEYLAELMLSSPCDDFASGVYPGQDGLIQMMGEIAGARILSLEEPMAYRTKLGAPGNRDLTFDLIRLFALSLDPDQTNAQWRSATALYLQGQNALSIRLEREYARLKFGDNRGPAIQDHVDDYMLDERNRMFLKTAQPELEQGEVFIAIGSWHLPDNAGMVALLRDAGFTVTRIVLPREVVE
ncbi:MAG: TraB/GumN family protein [Arenibacterium sp.]